MSKRDGNRRQFLQTTLTTAGTTLLGAAMAHAKQTGGDSKLHLACNQYPWLTFYRRQGRDFLGDLNASISAIATTGVDGYEPLAESPAELDRLATLLRQHRLQMRSLYVNSVLHEPSEAEQSIASVVKIAQRAKQLLDTRIIVTNPSPISWGDGPGKSDDQLRLQAKLLNQLGQQLSAMGLVLAYHNHDAELRHAAREFHHMMIGTDPASVTLCLDAHWIFRGSGNSSVALFDVLRLYGSRVTELHLRQSRDGVWTETFCDGDIDYRAVAAYLVDSGVKPHLVLEQAVEQGTPNTMDAVAGHRRSCQYAQEVLAPLGT
jgi:inosose dehydratase